MEDSTLDTKVDRRQAYANRHRAQGLCQRCSDPVAPGYVTYCVKHMPEALSRRPRWSDAKIAEFVKLRNDGVPMRDIATSMGISMSTAFSYAHRLIREGKLSARKKRGDKTTDI